MLRMRMMYVAVLSVAVLGSVSWFGWRRVHQATAPELPLVAPKPQEVTIIIEGQFQQVRLTYHEGETPLSLLKKTAQSDARMSLMTKIVADHEIVYAMYGKENGQHGQRWEHLLNGHRSQVAADQYQLRAGDTVEWVFGIPEKP